MMDKTIAGRRRILIVDDVEDNRIILTRYFARLKFETVEAASGRDALELIRTDSFDLILLDIMMPGIDGFEVLTTIRQVFTADELPVVMVTASATNTDVVKALGLGANDYVTKPVDLAVAAARVQTQLARRDAQFALSHTVSELTQANQRLEEEMTERKRSDARADHLVHHDGLTGLPNRTRLNSYLEQQMQDDESLAVMVIDIGGFKLINDTLGQRIGDAVLTTVANRLVSGAPDRVMVARIGSDEFAVVHRGALNSSQAAH